MEHETAPLPLALQIERGDYRCREGQNYSQAVIFCITARVGSTAFMAAFAGLVGAEELPEIFNPRHAFQGLQERYKALSLQEYVNRYHAEIGGGPRVYFKTNYYDMMGMLKPEGVARLFPRRRFIYLHRGDVVAQAYSLWKANRYNLWHARSAAAREQVGEIEMDESDLLRIVKIVTNLYRERTQWEQFFRRDGSPCLSFSFEEMTRDLDGITRRAYRFATGSAAPPGPIETPYVRTSNAADEENIARAKRFLAEA